MKISLYGWVHIKTIPCKCRILNPRISWIFYQWSRLLFNIFYCFCVFVKNISHVSCAYIWKGKRGYNAKPSAYYFYVKTKISVDFCICITVHEKCPYSHIWTEYGEIRSIFPYSVQMQKNTDEKNSDCGHFSRSVNLPSRKEFSKSILVKYNFLLIAR